jgi:hypothetical protein
MISPLKPGTLMAKAFSTLKNVGEAVCVSGQKTGDVQAMTRSIQNFPWFVP